MFVCWFTDEDELVPTGKSECCEARDDSSPIVFVAAPPAPAELLCEDSTTIWGLSWRCGAGCEVPLACFGVPCSDVGVVVPLLAAGGGAPLLTRAIGGGTSDERERCSYREEKQPSRQDVECEIGV